MTLQGKLKSINKDWETGKPIVSFMFDEASYEALQGLNDKLIDVEINVHKNTRSKSANALLWKCIGDIAGALDTDKWAVYLYMLKRHGGKYVHVSVAEEALEDLKLLWREIEVVGEIDGMADVLCYYGSHTYNTSEFSKLLNGVIGEMQEMGLEAPTSMEMKRVLEQWEKRSQSSQKTCSTV